MTRIKPVATRPKVVKKFKTEGRNCRKVIPVINPGGSNSLKSIKIKPVAKIKRRASMTLMVFRRRWCMFKS
jgi:hypothetical protein